MTAVDRRIGILFVAFIGLLGLALTRATELGTLKAGSLESAARTQQLQTVTVPAPRGTITDRHGVELAISESADDIAADPYLIKHADSAAARARTAALAATCERRGQPAKATHRLCVPCAPAPGRTGAGDQQAGHRRHHADPPGEALYPRGRERFTGAGAGNWFGQGASGIEYRYNAVLHGTNGIRRIVNDAIGQPISIDGPARHAAGGAGRADARRSAAGRGGAGARRRRPDI